MRAAQAATFTRRAYAWEGLADNSIHVIPPCIDPLSLKNVALWWEVTFRTADPRVVSANREKPPDQGQWAFPQFSGLIHRIKYIALDCAGPRSSRGP